MDREVTNRLGHLIATMQVAGDSPLEDFLGQADAGVAPGEIMRAIGFGLTLSGVVVGVGVVAFLAIIFRGPRREVAALEAVVVVSGGVICLGAVVELAGVVRLAGAVAEALTRAVSLAPLLRLVSGLLIVTGMSVDRGPNGSHRDVWVPGIGAAVGIIGLLIGVFSFSFDGHTLSEGPRLFHSLLSAVHVLAGGVWAGGVFALLFLSLLRRKSSGDPVSLLAVRFSVVAALALMVVTVAGVVMSWLIVDGWAGYFRSGWGQRLLLKTGAVALAAALGAYNRFLVLPALDRDPDNPGLADRCRATLAVEATVLVGVMIATVLLTTSSPN